MFVGMFVEDFTDTLVGKFVGGTTTEVLAEAADTAADDLPAAAAASNKVGDSKNCPPVCCARVRRKSVSGRYPNSHD